VSRRPAKKGARNADEPAGVYMIGPVAFMEVSDEAPILMPADVSETSDGILIRMEVPGVPADAIRVTVQGAAIEVAGEKKPDSSAVEASYLCVERSFGRFRRVFELSGCLNMAGVRAVLSKGVIALFVPKREERRGRARNVPVAAEPDA
jgi:HSP20 family protein